MDQMIDMMRKAYEELLRDTHGMSYLVETKLKILIVVRIFEGQRNLN